VRVKIASCLVAGALVVAVGCGGDDDDDTQASDTTAADAGASSGTAGAPVTTAETSLGEVLVNADGMTVYAFTNDTDGTPTCGEGCSDAWPAVTADSADLPAGLDSAVFSVVDGIGGGFQLAAGGQPLYTFSGDAAAGDVNGQGVGGIWFVVGADGETITEPAAAGGAGADTGTGGDATTTTTVADSGGGGSDDGGGYDY
jgi:predicted lipoprotein with Yx(FWY)xxD motif